jgi:hypothetical protein
MGPINGGPINLAHARLRHTFLRFATLTGADLRGADLADADLREARLERADLSGADLSNAQLDGVDFANASLAGANLCGASLAGARNLTTAQLHVAEGDAATVLPANVERPLIWTVSQGMDSQPIVARSAPRRGEEPATESRHSRLIPDSNLTILASAPLCTSFRRAPATDQHENNEIQGWREDDKHWPKRLGEDIEHLVPRQTQRHQENARQRSGRAAEKTKRADNKKS